VNEIPVPVALVYGVPLFLLMAGLFTGLLAGWQRWGAHQVIKTDRWRAEHRRRFWGGTEEWDLEYERPGGGAVRMPFERLMEEIAALPEEDWNRPMGELAARWGEPVERIADAIDVLKVLQGQRTYISLEEDAREH
jgi:hypothetical protein